jgi:hypothetical protein
LYFPRFARNRCFSIKKTGGNCQFVICSSDDLDEDDFKIGKKFEEIHDDHFCLGPNIRKVLVKCRKLVKYFKNSTVRNPILQKHVIEEFNKELKLIFDCETRWNSSIPMIERLRKLKNCIAKTLIDIGAENIIL